MTNRQFLLNMLHSIENTPIELKSIPTQKIIEKTVKNILNSILYEKQEWKYAISVLVTFPIQSWALRQRKLLKIDSSSILKIISYETDEDYFGFECVEHLERQAKNTEISEKATLLMEDILYSDDSELEPKYKEILDIVHGKNPRRITRYQLLKNYEDAVRYFCEHYNEKFEVMLAETIDDSHSLDFDIQLVYHDTKTLMNLYKNIYKTGMGKTCDLYYPNTVKSIESCLKALNSYKLFSYDQIPQILIYVAHGMKQCDIADKMEKSQFFISQKYNEGIKILSILIWGCTSKEIIEILNSR